MRTGGIRPRMAASGAVGEADGFWARSCQSRAIRGMVASGLHHVLLMLVRESYAAVCSGRRRDARCLCFWWSRVTGARRQRAVLAGKPVRSD